MIVLTLTFCLSATPTICQQVSPQEYTSGIACLLEAEERAAEWQAEHPLWKLTRMRCGPREKQA